MLHDGEQDDDVLAPDHVASLIRLYGTDDQAVLRRKVVYTFHARMADRWRDRRVFLAGDAAHLMPPFAGQGMNSGIRDAHNLAWKLAMVVAGGLGEGLLDSYQIERQDHVAQMTQLAIRMGHVMMPRTRLQAFALQTFFRALALYPPASSYFAEMKYKPKPRFHAGFMVPPSRPSRQSFVGRLFPQALVMTAAGFALLDDVLGDGFALVVPPGTSPHLLAQAHLTNETIRQVAILGREDATPVELPIVGVRDLRGDLAALLAGQPQGLYLLRPDRYVAAFLPADDIAAASAEVERLMRETWAQEPAPLRPASATNDDARHPMTASS
jgi:3-(3-hydroxy-phenyl)propionate hydroxylase